uniref:Uncharacterized protein n=1 Tax=Amphimedon queenslandica TaxID=400682 RepID=A0A1X7U8W9_AMPQE
MLGVNIPMKYLTLEEIMTDHSDVLNLLWRQSTLHFNLLNLLQKYLSLHSFLHLHKFLLILQMKASNWALTSACYSIT